jgi:hypothetical protein
MTGQHNNKGLVTGKDSTRKEEWAPPYKRTRTTKDLHYMKGFAQEWVTISKRIQTWQEYHDRSRQDLMAYAGNNLTTIKEACEERKDDPPGYRFSCSHVKTNFERRPTLNIKSSYEVWIILRKMHFLVKKHFISVTHLGEVFFFICPSKKRPDR